MSDNTLLSCIKNIFNKKPKDINDLVNILKHATQLELLEPNTLSMLEGVLDVQETRVKDVMVPRSQMVTIERDMSLEKIVPIVAKSRHSRYPVLGENKEEVVGIMLAKDLLNYGFNYSTQPFNMRDIIRPAIFIPEIKRLNVLLQEFRLNHNHMAMVVDEYGRITGLITIEDVLEQIVGEIEDEHDTDTNPTINPQADGSYTVKALTQIQEFNDYFGTDIDEEGIETIGGVIMRAMGHLPKRGEGVIIGDMQFTVLRADNRRLHLLSVIPKYMPPSS